MKGTMGLKKGALLFENDLETTLGPGPAHRTG